MLSEAQVRELLECAASTVPVAPTGVAELTRERKLRRTPLVACLLVAAVAVTALVGIRLAADPEPPTDRPDSTVLPVVDRYELADDQVPLLFGQTVDAARTTLEARGWTVRVEHSVEACHPDDRVWTTVPTVGTTVAPGGAVTILAPVGWVPECWPGNFESAWSLIDLAFGRADRPHVSPTVNLWLGPNFHRTLSRDAASDPDNWVVCSDNGVVCASALQEIRAAAYIKLNARPTMPFASLESFERSFCDLGRQLPEGLPRGFSSAVHLSIGIPTDGIFCRPGPTLITDDVGRITDVITWTGLNPDGAAGLKVPDVTGLQARVARFRLMHNSFAEPKINHVEDCPEVGLVIAQSPAAGTLAAPYSTGTLDVCRTDDVSADPEDIGRAFKAYAASSFRAPLFADEVGLWLGNSKVREAAGSVLARGKAADWQVCPDDGTYAGRPCPFSALDAIKSSKALPKVQEIGHPQLGACASGVATDDLPASRFAVLGVAEPNTCDENWNVEVYYDEYERITDVNLLLGPATWPLK